jgi:two-component system KDP operon response regulator KdpE
MSDTQPTILIIEDEPQIRRFLRATLGSQGYTLLEATTAQEGLSEAASHPPDIVLLDLGLPDMDGLEVIARLREWTPVPIIIISARGQEHDKVAALDSGADDYLTKPFGVAELMARVRVAMRHANRTPTESADAVFRTGELEVDLAHRLVHVGEKEIRLTPIEFKLLALLVKHAGKVLTHRQILKEVWGPNYADESHYLRVFVHQLRHKVEADPARPKYLVTEAGVGYRLRTE